MFSDTFAPCLLWPPGFVTLTLPFVTSHDTVSVAVSTPSDADTTTLYGVSDPAVDEMDPGDGAGRGVDAQAGRQPGRREGQGIAARVGRLQGQIDGVPDRVDLRTGVGDGHVGDRPGERLAVRWRRRRKP